MMSGYVMKNRDRGVMNAEGSDGGNAGDERTNENLKRILSGTIRRIWKKDEKEKRGKKRKEQREVKNKV